MPSPEATTCVAAFAVGTLGWMRNIPVFAPVSTAVKVSVSPVKRLTSVIGRVSTTVGSVLHWAALICTKSGAPSAVCCATVAYVLLVKKLIVGSKAGNGSCTRFEFTVFIAPAALKSAYAVLASEPDALPCTVTLNAALTVVLANSSGSNTATASMLLTGGALSV